MLNNCQFLANQILSIREMTESNKKLVQSGHKSTIMKVLGRLFFLIKNTEVENKSFPRN